jgi:hypothetical protein
MRFICDGMLGTLCKYLRICGIDAAFCNEGMKILVRAKKEDRVILTRNTRLIGRDDVFFVDTDDPREQFARVRDRFALKTKKTALLTRCLVCNEKLVRVDRDLIRERIPYYTYKKFDAFAECPKCKKVYWQGSHYKNMVEKLKKL